MAAVASILVLLFMCILAPAASASATETVPSPEPTPVSTPEETPVLTPEETPEPTPVIVADPVIQRPSDGALVGDAIAFSGTAEPGSGIDLFSSAGGQPICSVVASDSGEWQCSATVGSASSVTVRAVQSIGGQTNETSVQVSVLNAPTAGPGGGGTVSSGTVMGSAVAGATVTATVGSVTCQATADASGAWFCQLPAGLSSGTYSLTASQVAPWSGGRSSASSAPRGLTIDVDAPAPPGVVVPATSPVPLSGAVFSGEGEEGATVTVFAGPNSLCQATVVAGRWSCTAAALDAGTYSVSAIQQDAAGNISDESARVSVVFGAAPTPSTAPAPQPTPGAAQPAPTTTAVPALPARPDEGEPSAMPGDGEVATPEATAAAPAAPDPGAWSAATRFSASMQPAFGRPGSIDWTLALGIGLAIVTLLAVPARLLAGTLGGLRSAPETLISESGRFTGRNRSRHEEFDAAPALAWGTRLTGGFALAAAAAITVLSAPVDDQPAYLRLLVAVAVGILVVNAVAVAVPRALARWVLDLGVEVRLRPIFLLVSVGATLVSRAIDLDPALVFGIVFGVALTTQTSRRAHGRLAALQVGSLLVVGSTALLISGATPSASDVVGAFLSELVNTVALSSLGGAAILLLPIGDLPGRYLLRWKPVVWLALAIVGFTMLGGLLSSALGGLGGGAGIILLALASLAFAAACVATWVWVRFVRSPAESSTRSGD